MAKDPYNAEARRRVLQNFIDRNKLKVQTWTNASDLSEAGLRAFLAGRADSMSDRTYAKLASGAAKLLERPVNAAALRGDKPGEITVPIHHLIGAGDEIHVVEGNEPIGYTESPPGYGEGGAGIVRGDSMRPLYEDGDVLFWRVLEMGTPKSAPRRAVVVKVTDGALYVKKLLPSPRKGRYHLLSVNPVTPVMEDQPVEAIARIGWVKPFE